MVRIIIHQYLEHRVSDKGRNRSWDVSGGNERHDGDHGKTSVVQFSGSLDLHCGFIDRSEVDWWEDDSWKVSSLCVVNPVGFADEFSKEDHSVNLLLSCKHNREKIIRMVSTSYHLLNYFDCRDGQRITYQPLEQHPTHPRASWWTKIRRKRRG